MKFSTDIAMNLQILLKEKFGVTISSQEMIELSTPNNIGEYIKDKNTESSNVLCSIRTDIEVLNAISKIITIMATSNQCLLQAPSINGY